MHADTRKYIHCRRPGRHGASGALAGQGPAHPVGLQEPGSTQRSIGAF